jgi:hypothetical protein
MNWILKNKNKNAKALLIVLFFVFISCFYYVKITHAADAPVTTGRGSVQNPNQLPSGPTSATSATPGATGRTDPTKGVNGYVAGTNPTANKETVKNTTFCSPLDLECYFKLLLIGVFNAVGWLMAIAATLFAWAIEPNNVSGTNGMLNKQAVKDVWIMVRDLLNMTFILILLFAAFCTIFQIDKWNLKKVWLNVLINALLVNFSFPIARFFIDVSNVAFYYFVNHLFSATGTTVVNGSSIFASFGASTNIGELLSPQNYTQYSVAYLIGMIVVTFIIGMTLLVVAALFMVRLVALTMLVMFSPIGFVGYIFPSTSNYADKWWTNLFKYSFFAPIMIFMMAIAIRITTVMGQENFSTFKSNAINNATPNDASWIANAAFLAIPIIILWAGIGVAQSMGIAGASTVVSSVKKGGKWLANRPGALGGYAWKKTGIPGGVKKGMDDAKKSGKLFGSSTLGWFAKDGTDGRAAGIASVMGKKKGVSMVDAYKKAGMKSNNNELDEDVKKAVDRHDAETTTQLKADLASTSKFNEAKDLANRDKGVEYMSKYKQLMSDPIRKQEHEAEIRQSAISTAALDPNVAAAHLAGDSVAKTAAIEAHVQKQIAQSYGDMKQKYQEVKKAHSKV